jgi:hypothetical protein
MSRRSPESGGIVGFLVGLLALACVALVAVFLFGIFVARNVHVEHRQTASGETVRVETPVGSIQVKPHQRLDPKTVGIPIYPGAFREDNDGHAASFEFDSDSTHKEFTVLGAEYSTSDSVDKVRDFYSKELPHWIISKSRHGRFSMEYSESGYKRFVVIDEKHGRTHIALASVGEPASN